MGTMESVAAPLNKTPYRPVPSHITPLSVDVIFFEKVNRDAAQWRTVPTYNTAHPNSTDWPNHKFCYVEPSDEPGFENWWYVADFTTQGLYNFEAALNQQTDWPKLTQTWIIPRAVYTGPGHTSGITVPPSLGRVWTRTGDSQARIGVEKLDSRFVVLRIDYEDISQPLRRQRIADESGQIVEVTITKVSANTAGQQADAAGFITEIAPINTQWALATKDKVSSLIGAGIRNYTIHRPYPWPKVLMGFSIHLNVDLSFGYDYLTKSWNGECRIDVQEFWSLTRPIVGTPIALGGTSIRWDGALLNVNIPETLHGLIQIREDANGRSVWRNYFPTPYSDWPPTMTIFPSVRPHPRGGFHVTKWTVFSPTGIIG